MIFIDEYKKNGSLWTDTNIEEVINNITNLTLEELESEEYYKVFLNEENLEQAEIDWNRWKLLFMRNYLENNPDVNVSDISFLLVIPSNLKIHPVQ